MQGGASALSPGCAVTRAANRVTCRQAEPSEGAAPAGTRGPVRHHGPALSLVLSAQQAGGGARRGRARRGDGRPRPGLTPGHGPTGLDVAALDVSAVDVTALGVTVQFVDELGPADLPVVRPLARPRTRMSGRRRPEPPEPPRRP